MAKYPQGPPPNVTFLFSLLALTGTLVVVSLTSSGVLRGPRGVCNATCTGATEVFSIAMRSDHVFANANLYESVVNWTDAVDTLNYPDVSPSVLFQHLNASVLDLAAGTFTVGTAGTYQFFLTQNGQSPDSISYVRLTINGAGNLDGWQTDAALYPSLLNLDAGMVVGVEMLTLNLPTTTPAAAQPFYLPGAFAYNLIWKMVKVF